MFRHFAVVAGISAQAQEILAKVTVNSSQVDRTDGSVFENLQQTLEQFINDRQWTNLQFQRNERIVCNINLTITKYDPSANTFSTTALIQANRPVYNSAYTTTIYNNRDGNFDFEFAQFDQLDFNEEVVDNQLAAWRPTMPISSLASTWTLSRPWAGKTSCSVA